MLKADNLNPESNSDLDDEFRRTFPIMTSCRHTSEMTQQELSLRRSISRLSSWKLALSVLCTVLLIKPTYGFVSTRCSKNLVHPMDIRISHNNHHLPPSASRTRLHDLNSKNNNDNVADDNDYDNDQEEPVFAADVRGRPAGVVLEDLDWRVAKLRLEEANTRRFLKAGPRFLPYEECRKWVQAWGQRWRSAQEWYVLDDDVYDVI